MKIGDKISELDLRDWSSKGLNYNSNGFWKKASYPFSNSKDRYRTILEIKEHCGVISMLLSNCTDNLWIRCMKNKECSLNNLQI